MNNAKEKVNLVFIVIYLLISENWIEKFTVGLKSFIQFSPLPAPKSLLYFLFS